MIHCTCVLLCTQMAQTMQVATADLGNAHRLLSRYSDRLFWQVSSCSLRLRSMSSLPSTLQASMTLGFLAVSIMIFLQALSMPSKRLASCIRQAM